MVTFVLLAAVAALVLIIYGNHYARTHRHPCPCRGGCLAMGKTVPVCPRVRMGSRKTSLDLVNRPDVISSHELSGLHYN